MGSIVGTPRQRICFIAMLLLSTAVPACRRSKPAAPWQQRLQRDELSESQFTEIMADAIRETMPNYQVKVLASLELSVSPSSGTSTCYLDNVWKQVRVEPDLRVDIVKRHLEMLRSTMDVMATREHPQLDEIVPIVKDQRWLDEADRQGLRVYRQPLAADLSVVYAVDGTHQLAFLSAEDVKAFQLSSQELRTRSLENLQERLGKISRHGEGPLYMMTAGGTFEASLLLLDDVWKEQDEAVDGSVVVAIPSRDLLLFTGENATEAIQRMRTQVEDVFDRGSYLISRTLLVRDQGTWRAFDR